ncbi:MAG TPA: penicillin-binding protein 2 [Phenylobacterium sp.]|uniref:peptidoglycan D,D-transpeptidase FtsI family protein n=1 Tax=Phenylobacterium sp. TaxID=1871053 RepID=UPI002CB694F8|nr:penicillin-binding protein 2 [Phenylobacterium sp.]HSV02713.1 penicillin-binding protein 2 [Phenylobacterium sp.]
MSLGQQAFGGSPVSRALARWLWGLEHAFERARASGKAEDDARIRIFVVLVFFALCFVALAIGATRAALFSEAGRSDPLAVAAGGARADLVDRNGRLLAVDLLHYGLYVDPREIWELAETRRALSAALPDLPPERLERALRANRRTFLTGGLTPDARGRINDLGLPGVSFEPEEKRVYPLGETAAHLIGFTDSGGEGLAGAELAFNEDARTAAASGAAVPLSIDLRIQAALEDELGKTAAQFQPKGAVGIVTDVHTGEILGLASWPSFDPNRAGEASPDARLDRAASSVFEMGSVFKAFTMAIGLDTGVATPQSTFDATQPLHLGYRTITDYHATHKILTMVEVFQHSSNIGTAKLAVAVGPERMSRYFDALGLTRPAKVELLESARPLTPKVWNEDAIASTSFGHGIDVSPLALVRAYGALLNGGYLLPLTIRKLEPGARVAGPRVVSDKTSLEVLQLMRANVTGGSGKSAEVPGLNVGGKTGTGDKYDPALRRYSHTKQVSSFAAAFPTDGPTSAPRYLVFILLDEPHPDRTGADPTGGIVAAPAVGRVIERIAPFLGVGRRPELIPFEPGPPAAEEVGEEQ